MGIIGKDFKYKKIENFLSKEEIMVLRNYCRIKHTLNLDSFDTKQNNNGDTYFYGDPLMDSLMLAKHNLMVKHTGKDLFPTYSFWRMYTKFAVLKKHKDRPSCEISVTVHIGSDNTPWPIYMDGKPMDTKPGDAVIYLGCELEHWRDEFKGDWAAQTFLHYVDANGKYKDYIKDKRDYWGMSK
tara:strand:- start:314 stop:862 length:549 start_codon:yes stop_codon:yes gene_type:complete